MYRPFTLHKRPTTKSKRIVYYCQFRDSHGKRMTSVSTGKTNKAEAYLWAQECYESGLINTKDDMLCGKYTENWFDWEKSESPRKSRRVFGWSPDHKCKISARFL